MGVSPSSLRTSHPGALEKPPSVYALCPHSTGTPTSLHPHVPRALTVEGTPTSLHPCVPRALTVWGTPTSLHQRVPCALSLQGIPTSLNRVCPVPSQYGGPRQASIRVCPMPSLYRGHQQASIMCALCPHCMGTPRSLHLCVPRALTIEGDPQFSNRAPSGCLRNALSGQLPVSLRPRRGDLSFCLLRDMF